MTIRPGRPVGLLSLAAALVLGGFVLARGGPAAAEGVRLLPPPALDETPGHAAPEVAVFAGGCFWGVQGVFEHVAGVTSAVSGYAGGTAADAHYRSVGTGATGHAESVRVTYDPARISYGALLRIFFSVAHDPTELNRQGPDTGTQYRSAVFPQSPEQERVAAAYLAQLGEAHAFAAPVVTRVEPGRAFFPAEGYHQDFLYLHPDHPYIVINDLPKVAALHRLFPAEYRDAPVLTSAPASGS